MSELILQEINSHELTPGQIRCLIRPECIAAIQSGTYTLPWLIARHENQLEYLTMPACIQALQAQPPVFSVQDLAGLNGSQIRCLTRPECIAAIQSGTYTLPWLIACNDNQLEYLTSPECIQAINDGVFTLQTLAVMSPDQLYQVTRPEYIQPIRERLIRERNLIFEKNEIKNHIGLLYPYFSKKISADLIVMIIAMGVTHGEYNHQDAKNMAYTELNNIEKDKEITKAFSTSTLLKQHGLLNTKQSKDPKQQHEFDKRFGLTILKK